jgi:hypothetical protein
MDALTWSPRVAVLAVAALLAAACSTAATPIPTSTPLASVATPSPAAAVPTPVATETALATISPTAPGASHTPRPALEVGGRLTIEMTTPAAGLGGAARCTVAEGADAVSDIKVNAAGTVGGHRVFVWLQLLPDGTAHIQIGQGMENLPADAGLPEYIGVMDSTGASMAADATTGSLRFT